MSRTVAIDQMAAAVVAELKDYCQEVTDGLKEDVKAVSKETVQELKSTSPKEQGVSKRKGRYAKGWYASEAYESDTDIRITVHNKTDYQLAHLLEFGHEVVVAGKVVGHFNGIPHIRPAEEQAEEKLMKKVKVRVRA